jgi:hypothetical protein
MSDRKPLANLVSVGTLPNQTLNGLPEVATTSGTEGDPGNGVLSFLPGQRLSACTCPSDETHPGPRYTDGSFRGRSAPEVGWQRSLRSSLFYDWS